MKTFPIVTSRYLKTCFTLESIKSTTFVDALKHPGAGPAGGSKCHKFCFFVLILHTNYGKMREIFEKLDKVDITEEDPPFLLAGKSGAMPLAQTKNYGIFSVIGFRWI